MQPGKRPTNGRERLIERLTESLENYRQIYERKLATTYQPGDLFPSYYLANLDHYARMFLWCPCLSPDTLVRLNASVVCDDSIDDNSAPQVTEFAQLIDELSSYIQGGY